MRVGFTTEILFCNTQIHESSTNIIWTMLTLASGRIILFICIYFSLSIAVGADAIDDSDILRLNGVLLDDNGNGISGAKLQIWQTDLEGIYDHPRSIGFDGGDELDPSFQYFGTATSEDDGAFSFLTIRPGLYPARPISHIHFKIFVSDELKLTTQLYFADEDPPYPSSLVMNLSSHPDGGFETNVNIALDMGGGGSQPLTPSQPAGPYYPVVDFFDVGNILIVSDVDIQESSPSPTPAPQSISCLQVLFREYFAIVK